MKKMFLVAAAAATLGTTLLESSVFASGQTGTDANNQAKSDLARAPDQTSQDAPSDKDDKRGDSISRVVVTATKRAQFAEKVPASLSAWTQDSLEKDGVTDLQDLSRLTPGLSVTNGVIFGSPNIAVRGVSSQIGAATTAI